MKRRIFLKNAVRSAALVCYSPALLAAQWRKEQTKSFPADIFEQNIIPIPTNAEDWPAFRQVLAEWRKNTKKTLAYNDTLYNNPAFEWAHSAYNCYFLMMYDEAFCDPTTGRYKVEEFLENETRKFGRFDIVVLWHAYPRIGLDDRNQFDFYRDMPGGLEGVRNLSRQLHQHGIKIFINYNPWDTGTRREPKSDVDAIIDIIAAIEADGIFLDTMENGAAGFREKLDKARSGVVLESEYALPMKYVHDHHLSWGQWFWDAAIPGILRNKWFERRHIQHGISRWQTDKTKELHTAWMNGSGVMIWENVFGQWLGWSQRDKWIMRLISPIQKRYTPLLAGENWMPMADANQSNEIFANLWYDNDMRLWTIVNRSENEYEGTVLHFEKKENEHYFDLIQGIEIQVAEDANKQLMASGKLTPRGVGCILAINKKLVDKNLLAFVQSQADIYKNGANGINPDIRRSQLKPLIRTQPYAQAPAAMVVIPATKTIQDVTFRVREIGYYESIDNTFINIGAPRLHHFNTLSKEVELSKFALDETPVTNAQFYQFIKATGYKPLVSTNFLKHWKNGKYPEAKADHPVVYVDLNDARAFAQWSVKRLPSEEEWQFAAQGTHKNKYPWGNKLTDNNCNVGEKADTTRVKSYPDGRSPFGCYDMCGNVWEMTESERSDGRNRFCILKGGSFFKAIGSDWYFDGGAQPSDISAKQLLIYPGIDRCATVGFRCAVDIK